ncbi:SDR family NAD(P)-dependent oxidoreductase [Streptomyces litmocidini]|uniref:SDR family NAD(P)-dependent oxidoreductase n=1 Tax=Streptomyces TaxID=1883 RepID=UPI000F4800D2|nr:SDR family NAD(P)-dependent oxidoreductase [Streptomyces sp. PanSC19]ROQ24598.1 NAD(P)-dependent dehydrogenase (short-subunit alcohol dehydrogenase family) [Streptomyces sp. PanSC19]
MDLRERFEGYAVLITGAGRGIGAATARRLAAEGARVLVTDVDEEAARATASEIPGAVPLRCDVADRASVDAAVAHAVKAFGRLDVLVNNALAPVTPDRDLFEDEPDEGWTGQLDVTLMGAVRCSRAAMPHLAAAGGRGAIVTIGSVNAEADFGGHAYSAAKAALASLTRTLAGDAAPRGVRVNQINPGTIATTAWSGREADLTALATRVYPLGRVGTPEDVAAAVAFLASADASWITGTTLRVDGGLLAVNTHFGEVLGER